MGETADLLAVSKPASLPMHPCGAYRFNSLLHLLSVEPLPGRAIPPDPTARLLLVHRLDRVTSGLVILAKSATAAATISEEIRRHDTEKCYLARVRGRFPGPRAARLRRLPEDELTRLPGEDGPGEDDGEPGDAEAGRGSGASGRRVKGLVHTPSDICERPAPSWEVSAARPFNTCYHLLTSSR